MSGCLLQIVQTFVKLHDIAVGRQSGMNALYWGPILHWYGEVTWCQAILIPFVFSVTSSFFLLYPFQQIWGICLYLTPLNSGEYISLLFLGVSLLAFIRCFLSVLFFSRVLEGTMRTPSLAGNCRDGIGKTSLCLWTRVREIGLIFRNNNNDIKIMIIILKSIIIII